MDRGAWGATVPGVAKSQTRLSDLVRVHCCADPGGLRRLEPSLPQQCEPGVCTVAGLGSPVLFPHFFLKNKDWNFTGPAPLLEVLCPQDPRPSAHPGVCRACKGEGLLKSVDPPPRLAPSDTVI